MAKIVLDAKRGSAYNDDLASHYHFPSRYLRTLEAALGDWAVFRRPRDGGEGIAYFGVGRIIKITPDQASASHFYASIEDYLPFPSPVPWKPGGQFAERALREIENVSRVGTHLRGQSVRSLDEADFDAIFDIGLRGIYDPSSAERWWANGIPPIDQVGEARHRERRLSDRAVRDAAFRKLVCEAYDDRCAVTRLRIINGGGRSEVQAAHIQPVEAKGPDLVQNGLALSATAHWLFDRHLITIDPDHRLVVAHNRVPSELRELLEPSVTRIHLPQDRRMRPSERFLSYHRERFATAA